MKQIEKNERKLLEEIEKLCNQPISDAIAAELSVYKSALDAVRMICDENSVTENRRAPDVRFYAQEDGYSAASASTVLPMTKHFAEEWVSHMKNVDGTHGGHWTMDQAEQVRAQRGFDCDPVQFWAAMNMMYSDYCVAAKKAGANTVDFYADMARAFLDDKDAKPHKMARYMKYVADAGETTHTTPRSGGSEFLEIVSGKDQTAAWSVIDGHMKRMKEVNPKVYNIIIGKLKEL